MVCDCIYNANDDLWYHIFRILYVICRRYSNIPVQKQTQLTQSFSARGQIANKSNITELSFLSEQFGMLAHIIHLRIGNTERESFMLTALFNSGIVCIVCCYSFCHLLLQNVSRNVLMNLLLGKERCLFRICSGVVTCL